MTVLRQKVSRRVAAAYSTKGNGGLCLRFPIGEALKAKPEFLYMQVIDMKNVIIVSSVTYAMKGQSALSKHGISSALTRAEGVRSVKGCGYGLRIYGDIGEAALILKRSGIRILGYAEER